MKLLGKTKQSALGAAAEPLLPNWKEDDDGRSVPESSYTTRQLHYINFGQLFLGSVVTLAAVACMHSVYPWPRTLSRKNYSKNDFACICAYTALFPLGFGLATSAVSRIASFPFLSTTFRGYFLALLSATTFIMSVWYLFEGHGNHYFILDHKWPSNKKKGLYRPLLSFTMFILAVPISICLLCMALRAAKLWPPVSHSANPMNLQLQGDSALAGVRTSDHGSDSGAPLIPASQKRIGICSVLLLLAFSGLYFATCILPNDWHRLVAHKIYHASRTKTRDLNKSDVDQNVNNWKWGKMYLHLYPDVYAFYFLLVGTMATGMLLRRYQTGRKAMSRIVFLKEFNHPLMPTVFYIRLGELIVTLLLAALLTFVFVFMGFYHKYPVKDYQPQNKRSDISRTFGILATIVCGLLLIPVSRSTALLQHSFGLSLESSVKYHRYLGALFVCFSLVHIIMMVACFWSFRMPASGDRLLKKAYPFSKVPWKWKDGDHYQTDNFSNPLMYIVCIFVLIPVFGVMAFFDKIRRLHWEVWHFTHLWAAGVLVISLMFHATNGWYFMAPGMALQFADRLFRLWHSGAEREVVALQSADSAVTHLSLATATPHCSTPLAAYCFVNVPHISPWQWHPFSVANAVNSQATDFYVKSSEEPSFSRSLLHLAAAYSLQPSLEVCASTEGPHGVGIRFEDYRRVTLVAGGIGVTPLHSVFASLLNAHRCDQSAEQIPDVCLLWSVRYAHNFDIFADTLSLLADTATSKFKVSLYVTDESEDSDALVSAKATKLFPFRYGFANIDMELADLNPFGEDALVYACGPPALVQLCLRAAYEQGNQFKSESFLF